MTADPFSTVKTELPRDRWGRPLITPPEGGDPVAYQRVTTFVGALEDTYHLSLWAQRMVALGMTRRRDLVLAASAISDPDDKIQKRNLNDIAKQAKDAAQGSAAAITGTAIHAFTERIDRGEQLTDVPEEHAADLEAYRGITTGLVALGIEGFCVCDGLRVGGSYDRIYQFTDLFLGRYAEKHGAPLTYPGADGQAGQEVKAGGVIIADLKTGNVDYGLGKIAMQLGVYAHSEDYDHTLGTRTPLAGGPSKEWALVIHLPAGMGSARLLWVNIAAGWETARTLAVGVHAWRKRKDLANAFTSLTATPTAAPSLVEQISAATSYAELKALYAANAARWTPGLTSLAAERRTQIEAHSSSRN